MENNPATNTTPVQQVNVTPQATQAPQASPVQPQVSQPPASPKSSRKWLYALLAIVVIFFLIAIPAGYLYWSNTKINNAPIQLTKKTVVASPTPTPSVYQSNPNDTTDQAINQDTQQTNNDLNSVDSALNNVDQGLNDQQTNLQ